MAIERKELITYLDQLLQPHQFNDYAPMVFRLKVRKQYSG